MSTGLQVRWAQRGYNPHHRKVPSYYPITAYEAQSGQVLRVQNRPGNVDDGKAGVPLSARSLPPRWRSHARAAATGWNSAWTGPFSAATSWSSWRGGGADYAIKVPFYPWLGLKARVLRGAAPWTRVTADGELRGVRGGGRRVGSADCRVVDLSHARAARDRARTSSSICSSFGHGVHRCAGAYLAQLEMQCLVRAWRPACAASRSPSRRSCSTTCSAATGAFAWRFGHDGGDHALRRARSTVRTACARVLSREGASCTTRVLDLTQMEQKRPSTRR